MRFGASSRVIATLVLTGGLAACDCGGDDDCDPAIERCGGGDAGARDGSRGEDGAAIDAREPDGGGTCETLTLCGTPPRCCASGEECVEGACVAACSGGVRCGAALDVCCEAGQVCVSAACTTPGEECTDSFDCPLGAFCEPTLDRCLPQFDPVSCERPPVFGPFAARVEWSATAAVAEPTCMHGISAPIVVDLTGDGAPEVVASFACDDDWQRAVLRAYRGDGTPLWSASDAALQLNGRKGIAAADLDGDGRAEVVGTTRVGAGGNRPIAIDDDGTLLFLGVREDGTTPLTGIGPGAPTIADLDGDGSPEILFGAMALDATGRLVWTRDGGASEGTNSGYEGGIAAVVNVDGDGRPEVVTGRRAYRYDGTPMWTAETPDGYPAIANFDADPQPEVVLVASGNVYLLDGVSGEVEWGPVAIPGGGRGGPPTVADFDGDGKAEIGVAGASSYSVYDPEASSGILWSMPTQDQSSNATGSSVFDFEGDGAAEVVYGDECFMRVYRGTDGMVLLEIPSTSATILEYPLVVDADADGNSEIVIVANDRDAGLRTRCRNAYPGWEGARRGLFVYGDERDQWMRTRRIWNQHAYHVTNVTPNGSAPMTEMDNWSTPGLNNYRQNVQGEGVYNAPNLNVLALEARLDGCPGSVTLRARVGNAGTLGVPAGVSVSFRAGTATDPGDLLGVALTTAPLLPGGTTVVALEDVPLTGAPPYAFFATVDDDADGQSTVTECDETDNTAAIAGVDCDLVF